MRKPLNRLVDRVGRSPLRELSQEPIGGWEQSALITHVTQTRCLKSILCTALLLPTEPARPNGCGLSQLWQ